MLAISKHSFLKEVAESGATFLWRWAIFILRGLQDLACQNHCQPSLVLVAVPLQVRLSCIHLLI